MAGRRAVGRQAMPDPARHAWEPNSGKQQGMQYWEGGNLLGVGVGWGKGW